MGFNTMFKYIYRGEIDTVCLSYSMCCHRITRIAQQEMYIGNRIEHVVMTTTFMHMQTNACKHTLKAFNMRAIENTMEYNTVWNPDEGCFTLKSDENSCPE